MESLIKWFLQLEDDKLEKKKRDWIPVSVFYFNFTLMKYM